MSKSNFQLSGKFVSKYSEKVPPFGFNGLGELTFMRTYSRLKCTSCGCYKVSQIDKVMVCDKCESPTRNEKWFETIERVVNGTYNIQRNYIIENGLGWDDKKGQKSAQEMYDRMFYMKFLPPGRGLWAMGTELIEERKLFASLNSCGFVSTDDMINEPTKPFEFLMDMSMLGVGIGFDTKGAGTISIYKPTNKHLYVIPDTREGWVVSLRLCLAQYFIKGSHSVEFNYQEIRAKGLPIKGFGGKASGPEPLMNLHEQLNVKFNGRNGFKITSRDIVDVQNMIGTCVVAGNVRRTAEIAFGEIDDEDFLKLKDYHWNKDKLQYEGKEADRSAYGWASNNSIFAQIGMNYKKHSKQTSLNGEPGYAWLENMKDYGRMNEPADYIDFRVKGANPCNEQSLESYEMCCLVESFPFKHDSLKDYQRTLKFAYLYAKTVTLGSTHWVETNRVLMRNKRIGTSMSGIAQFIDNRGIDEFKKYCEVGYETIKKYDSIYSDWFCVQRSIKTTSIKPSGTVSLLAGATPGMHWPESNCYIRRITLSATSDLIQPCLDAGYKVEPSINPKGSMIVEFPVKIEGVRSVSEVSLWEQVALASFLQQYWADNQVSCTVTFNPKEADQIEHALNYFQYKLKGISFLPKTDIGAYAQMPYEEISEDTYNELSAKINKLKFDEINQDSKSEMYCDSQKCISI